VNPPCFRVRHGSVIDELVKENIGKDKILLAYYRTLLALKLDKRAVTTIEYGLIAALIAVVIIMALTNLGRGVSTTFSKVASEL
jgi:pilus assembly protein Flp/PilA